jgi:cation transport protein ChaC
MWCFGYGSLMWDSWEREFAGTRVEGAELRGFHRAFNKASTRNWGSKANPGPTLGLEPDSNGAVIGVAFSFSDNKQPTVIERLRAREGGSFTLEAHSLLLSCPLRTVTGLVPINSRSARTYIGDLPLAQRIAMAKAAHGTSGSCAEYVWNVHAELGALGIRDAYVEEFASQLAKTTQANTEADT